MIRSAQPYFRNKTKPKKLNLDDPFFRVDLARKLPVDKAELQFRNALKIKKESEVRKLEYRLSKRFNVEEIMFLQRLKEEGGTIYMDADDE